MFLGYVHVGYMNIFIICDVLWFYGVPKGTVENGCPINAQMEGSNWSTIDDMSIWGFLKMVDPQNGGSPIAGLFIMENPIKMDDLGIPPF